MRRRSLTLTVALALVLLGLGSRYPSPAVRGANAVAALAARRIATTADNPNPPTSPVKLVFIHHSTGENWLADWDGGLGIALRDNNYFVSDTNYGWGPADADVGSDTIGDHTDIGHWYNWFVGPHRDTYLSALYTESARSWDFYSRLPSDPGGENEVIMFKSCFPNSHLGGSPTDPPATGDNPLRGQDAWSEHMTVGNAKGIYNDLLTYFATRQDKLFVVITAPPLVLSDTDAAHAANARAFNNWLVNDWLDGYPHNNVAVFDFYNVLTSNGGDANTNDLGWEIGNHHRWWNGAVQHIQTVADNFAAYGSGDSHPTTAGNQKATGEFVQLLNVFYHRWKEGQETPTPTATGTPSTPTSTATATPTPTGTPEPSCPADVNGDGIVDVLDIQTVAAWWHQPGFPPEADLNDDGVVDIRDIMTVAAQLGQRCATATPTATGTPTATPTATPTGTSGPGTLDVPLTVQETAGVARTNEPVTSGVPIPRSLNLTDLSVLRLLDAGGDPVPAQFIPLARWGGAPTDISKPVRWLLLDFQADVPASGTATYRLVNSGGTTPTFPTLTVTDGASAVTVDTGAAQFSISKTDGRLSAPGLAAPLFGRVRSGSTDYTTAGPVTVEVALSGPMRASVRVKGAYRDAGGTPLLDYTSRYWFYAGQPAVRLFHTVENNTPCPLAEYEQLDCFDIGSGGSVDVADLSLVLPTDLTGPLTYQAGGEGVPASGGLTDDLLLYQDSSGTDHWDHYPTMTDWDGSPLDTRPRMQSYVTFRGYRTTLGGTTVDSGDQAAGWLTVTGSDGAWTVGVRDFWQNFPKALRAAPDGTLEIGLFPDEFGPVSYSFNLRAGEHKTHEIWLSPAVAGLLTAPPILAQAPPNWYVQSGAFPFLSVRNFADWPDHENYVNYQLDTAPTYEDWMDWFPNLPAAIENTDFYGIFDYGDVPLDYEGYGVSPMNVKYHTDYGMWMQWARGGDQRWFDLAEAADRHVADVDILHNLHSPRHWGDGIMFGHSYHDEEGFINPHRNYGGSHPDTAFGVPGLLTAYYLTGYEKALESALELADCIEYRLHNDSHLCDFFPPGECSGEGYGLGEGDGLYDAGSRPAANNLSIAVAAYRATADPRYLAVADALVDWGRASEQPYIDGPIAGDGRMMRPWMLNMVLRALAEYLEMRTEFGLPDTYDAEGSFLAYADWLRTYPWLDLDPIDTGPRAAYPYEWWFNGRTENNDPDIANWLLVGADALAYAHRLSGEADYLERAARLFRTGSRDPWYEGDLNTYSATKETANSVVWGHVFLHEWAAQQP